jgi:hypothetical protein
MESALTHQIAEYNRLRRSEGEPEMTQKRLAELLGVTQGAVSQPNPCISVYGPGPDGGCYEMGRGKIGPC